ncbi:hypothetical protein AB0E08_07515 [Streptomyces sp. NPDC048281]|uniref:hypothetical protein n=1 Tax=Streptomyces sp. NPDC048281 TaxID=3154715 RepID=UPI00343A40A2
MSPVRQPTAAAWQRAAQHVADQAAAALAAAGHPKAHAMAPGWHAGTSYQQAVISHRGGTIWKKDEMAETYAATLRAAGITGGTVHAGRVYIPVTLDPQERTV